MDLKLETPVKEIFVNQEEKEQETVEANTEVMENDPTTKIMENDADTKDCLVPPQLQPRRVKLIHKLCWSSLYVLILGFSV